MRPFRMISIVAALLAVAAPAWADEAFPTGNRLGWSLGLPAGLNVEYSHEFGRRAIFLSGGYWGSDIYGAHGGFTLERGGTDRKHFSVNLVGGYFHLFDDDRDELTKWGYGGAEAYFRYRAFFIAPAITIGSGKNQNAPMDGAAFLGRLGLLWRI